MKKMVRTEGSSRNSKYDNRYTLEYKKINYVIYTANEDDPDNLMVQVTESHPYDLAEYTWARKSDPVNVKYFRNGEQVGRVAVPEWDEDYYESADDYVRDVVDEVVKNLYEFNKTVEPRIDRT